MIVLLLAVPEVDFEASRLRRAVLLPLGAGAARWRSLLLVFGSGPGSSGVKVNLLGVQPVEAIRLLVVFALAAYFGRRLELLRGALGAADRRAPMAPLRARAAVEGRPRRCSSAWRWCCCSSSSRRTSAPRSCCPASFLALYGVGAGPRRVCVRPVSRCCSAGFALAYWIGEPATVRQRVMIWADPWNNGVPGGNQIAHGLWALVHRRRCGAVARGSAARSRSPPDTPTSSWRRSARSSASSGWRSIVLLYAILGWRCLRVASGRPGDYSAFLAVGVALGAACVQALVIASGLLGLVPLSGVVTPFLSFGRSSMLANCLAVGVVLAVAQRRRRSRASTCAGPIACGAARSWPPPRWLALAGPAGSRSFMPMTTRRRRSLAEQADGGYRFEYNPRLLAAARRWSARHDLRPQRPAAGDQPRRRDRCDRGDLSRPPAWRRATGCQPRDSRCYPLGGFAFHLVGDWKHQSNWGARNSSYIERDSDARLKGYDDRPSTSWRSSTRAPASAAGDRPRLPRAAAARPPALSAAERGRRRDPARGRATCRRPSMRGCRCGWPPALRDRHRSRRAPARAPRSCSTPATGEVLASVELSVAGGCRRRERGVDQSGRRRQSGLAGPGSIRPLPARIDVQAACRRRARFAPRATGPALHLHAPAGRTGRQLRAWIVAGRCATIRWTRCRMAHVDLARRARGLVQRLFRAARGADRPAAACSMRRRCSRSRSRVRQTTAALQADAAARRVRPGRGAGVAAEDGAGLGVHRRRRARSCRLAGAWMRPLRKPSRASSPARQAAAARPRHARCRDHREPDERSAGIRCRLPARPAPRRSTTQRRTRGSRGLRRTAGAARASPSPSLVENAGYGARAAAPMAGELVTAAREFGVIK